MFSVLNSALSFPPLHPRSSLKTTNQETPITFVTIKFVFMLTRTMVMVFYPPSGCRNGHNGM